MSGGGFERAAPVRGAVNRRWALIGTLAALATVACVGVALTVHNPARPLEVLGNEWTGAAPLGEKTYWDSLHAAKQSNQDMGDLVNYYQNPQLLASKEPSQLIGAYGTLDSAQKAWYKHVASLGALDRQVQREQVSPEQEEQTSPETSPSTEVQRAQANSLSKLVCAAKLRHAHVCPLAAPTDAPPPLQVTLHRMHLSENLLSERHKAIKAEIARLAHAADLVSDQLEGQSCSETEPRVCARQTDVGALWWVDAGRVEGQVFRADPGAQGRVQGAARPPHQGARAGHSEPDTPVASLDSICLSVTSSRGLEGGA